MKHLVMALLFLSAVHGGFASGAASGATTQPFDGSPWNVSTGNLSTHFIRASPIGAHPRDGVLEPPPTVETMRRMKDAGLVAYEDYVAWGAVEREPGKWDWTQHDAVEKSVHAAGLKYVVYNWVHFPPAWLRDQKPAERTLMKCLEHGKETNYLSIFDPRTIEHYDRFYKHLSQHFGEKIDGVYACILGPYGEGNYPLYVPDWINIGHCHEGFWCADPHAVTAHRAAMRSKYASIAALNAAWGTTFASFDDVAFPPQISETFSPHPDRFVTPQQRRRWVDFVTWYHQAMIDFTERSIRTTLKYFPPEKVRTKPGGNAGGVNPIAWGTYCPGYAKTAARFPGVVLQPADWHGAYFGDKWVATAYHFYGVPLGTEPAGGLDRAGFVKRLFSDASCGTQQLFTYDFPDHANDVRRYAHLITGRPGETDIAVFCPTTLYRLGGDLKPTMDNAHKLRDLADFDVLDELLVLDGALTPHRYKLLVLFQADYIDQPVLDRLDAYIAAGGAVLVAGRTTPQSIDGKAWTTKVPYTRGRMPDEVKKFASGRKGLKGWDGVADGVWVTRRGPHAFMFNTTSKAVVANGVEVPPHEIAGALETIRVSADGTGFVTSSGARFTPWGFNYDRDHRMRLLEDYWDAEWATVEADFREMRQLGANVVRVHLQFAKFMDAADRPNEKSLDRLVRLVHLAEDTGVYLDLTGLACYRKADVPPWYDKLSETERWAAQARFWEAVAAACKGRPGVFCYDLMNEPLVPTEKLPPDQWLHPFALAGFHYVQHVALDPAGRGRDEIASRWAAQMIAAIRKHDAHRPITIGMLPDPGSGFDPRKLAPQLDFVALHIYPERGKIDKAIADARVFDADKPLVIEEIFPMSCDAADLGRFIERSREFVDGHVGFYWGKTPGEMRGSKEPSDVITLAWLELFQKLQSPSGNVIPREP